MIRSRLGIAVLALSVLTPLLHAGETSPATATAPAAVATRTQTAILTDLQATSLELGKLWSSISRGNPLYKLIDDDVRKEFAPKAIPLVQKMNALLAELQATPKLPEEIVQGINERRTQYLTMLAFLGDPDAEAALSRNAESKDGKAALDAKLALSVAHWWKNHSDPAAQAKILDDVQALAKANPQDDTVATSLLTMRSVGAASPQLAKRAYSIVALDLTGALAQKIQAGPRINEPLAFSAALVNGKKIDTRDLKGKVVVIDFWATWCGPCVEEIPELTEFYQKFHDKGVEIVSVSADTDPADLKSFLEEHKGMTWPQVYDDTVLKKYHVDTFPTVYLLDKNGVLRYDDARGRLDELVPKLLEEAPATQPGTQATTKP